MKMILFSAILASQIFSISAFACRGNDKLINRSTNSEQQSCTNSGYCYGYGNNPDTENYEYYYGFHSSCEGRQTREVTEDTCQARNGSKYIETDTGAWGFCQI